MEKFLLIANPAAQSGKGALIAEHAAALLRAGLSEDALSVVFTNQPMHASDIAAHSEGFATIIALGGDGVIHEVVNGLMWRKAADRPSLGVIAAGSGNDYARALGLSTKIDQACDQLLRAEPYPVDIGKVNEDFFMETLSFGLDAAIALDTMERRKKSGRKGAVLYMESGFNQLMNHLDEYPYKASFDGGALNESRLITFAVQMGPYYGGGVKICPEAKLDDGLFDVCISHPPITALKAIKTFLKAKSGKHVGMPNFEFERARKLTLDFETEPPAQMDGEKVTGKHLDISIEHSAIRVLTPHDPL